jgi:Ca2+/Na+ antiporter
MDVIIFLQTTIIATNFPIMEKKNKKTLQFSWPYKRKNYVLFGVGVFVIIVGYLIMYSGEVDSFQSLVISPLLLLAGYLVIIPMALLSKK